MSFAAIRQVALALSLVAVTSLAPSPLLKAAQAEQQQARLVEYSETTDLAALAKKGPTVIFFFATWCPNCILTLTELSEKWDQIDPGATVVIADYDRETELKAKYGVTYQDTFVLLDADAGAAKLWNAGGIATLNENLRGK
ncbi:TlpA family protein disulfide reductase [Pseudorhizobium sp. NPDC055634]